MRPRPRGGSRPSRVGHLLRQILADILLTRVADPRLGELTITAVDMSPDLKLARVVLLVRQGADPEEIVAALDRALGFIKAEVAREHILRTMPEFSFLPDESLEKAEKLEMLLQAARKKSERETDR
uniref:Ribosome-binding factor A n=1 Tax=Desulfobacca acetoxidans TaxID=60893 RepID=A0A7V4LC54_9BACT